jgi:hypothetical protein
VIGDELNAREADMTIASLHSVNHLLDGYNKQQRMKSEVGKSPKEFNDQKGKTIVDKVTLFTQLGEMDTSYKISQKLIDGLLRDVEK